MNYHQQMSKSRRPNWLEGATIAYDPRPVSVTPNAIYVGIEPKGMAVGLNRLPDGATVLVLSHKLTEPHAGSVARFVASLSVDQLKFGSHPDQPFAGRTIVVEDASPDTCISLLLLARKLSGSSLSERWIDYADRWEAGDTLGTGTPEQSFGALQSSLVHAFIPPDLSSAAVERSGFITVPLELGCLFLDEMVAAEVDPSNLPLEIPNRSSEGSLLARARAHLVADRELAERVVSSGETVELALEIVGSNRRRLVDALILTENSSNRAIKSFVRSSHTAPRGQGYPFWALHRPNSVGTGNDITFSVDPASGVWLRTQWEALERAEDQAWLEAGEVRPRSHPRQLQSWQQSPLPQGLAPSDEPWWDGKPIYTIIAVPRFLPKKGDERRTLGTKLDWSKALHTVWSTSCPLVAFDLRDRATGAPVNIFEASTAGFSRRKLGDARVDGGASHCLVDLRIGPAADETVAVWSDTVARSLAAFLAQGSTRVDLLPSFADFDVIHGRGVAVVISHHGILLLQMKEGGAAASDLLQEPIQNAAKLLSAATRLESQLTKAREEANNAIASLSPRRKRQTLGTIFAILSDALQHAARPPERSSDPLIAAVQNKIEERWDAEKRFRFVIDEVKRLQEMTATASDLLTNEAVSWLAIVGFPFALLVNFFAFAAGNDNSILRGWTLHGIEFLPIVAWLGLGVLLSAGIFLMQRRRARTWRLHMRRQLAAATQARGRRKPAK